METIGIHVSFQTEFIKSFYNKHERLVLEIITNKNISPVYALKKSINILVNKLLIMFERTNFKETQNQFSFQTRNKSLKYFGECFSLWNTKLYHNTESFGFLDPLFGEVLVNSDHLKKICTTKNLTQLFSQ